MTGVRYVKLQVITYLEIPADQVGIDNFARWPALAGALSGFEEGAGQYIHSMNLQLMDADFEPPFPVRKIPPGPEVHEGAETDHPPLPEHHPA